MQQKDKIQAVSDLAFEAVDADRSNSIEEEELAIIMKEIAIEMNTNTLTEQDIQFVMGQLD